MSFEGGSCSSWGSGHTSSLTQKRAMCPAPIPPVSPILLVAKSVLAIPSSFDIFYLVPTTPSSLADVISHLSTVFSSICKNGHATGILVGHHNNNPLSLSLYTCITRQINRSIQKKSFIALETFSQQPTCNFFFQLILFASSFAASRACRRRMSCSVAEKQ